MMNTNQKVVFWITVVIVTLISIFPVRETTNGGFRKRGFFLWERISDRNTSLNDSYKREYPYSNIDLETLIAQLIPVVVIGGAAVYGLGNQKKKIKNETGN